MKKITTQQFIKDYKMKKIVDENDIYELTNINFSEINEQTLLELLNILFDGIEIIDGHIINMTYFLLNNYHEYNPKQIPLKEIAVFLEKQMEKDFEKVKMKKLIKRYSTFFKGDLDIYMPKCKWNKLNYHDYLKFAETHWMIDPKAGLAYYYEMSDEEGYEKLTDHIYAQSIKLSEDEVIEIIRDFTKEDDKWKLYYSYRELSNFLYNFHDEGIKFNKDRLEKEFKRISEMENVKNDALNHYNFHGLASFCMKNIAK